MHIIVLTLFPDMIRAGLGESIIGRAVKAGTVTVEAMNIRDYAYNKHNSVDDYTYGGGAGMLMQAEPVYQAICAAKERIAACHAKEAAASDVRDVPEHRTKVIYMSPQGPVLTQAYAQELAKEEDLIFLCGHYEGIDERVLEECVDAYLSIGDYVLTGGELPAMVTIDALARFIPGVLHNKESTDFESLQGNLLEYPQYSRPEEWHGRKVPEVLLSGHHANVERWRREQSIIRTAKARPDLLAKAELTAKEQQFLKEAAELYEISLPE